MRKNKIKITPSPLSLEPPATPLKGGELFRCKLFAIAIIIAILLQPIIVFADEAFIRKVIVVTNLNDSMVVSFNLEGAFTQGIIEAIDNGIPTTFTFFVKLNSINTAWFDSSVVDLEISRSIKYDSLKKQYIVTQNINGDKGEELKRTGDFSEAEKAMNEFKNILVTGVKELKKDDKYELRIKAELDKVKLPFYLEYVLIFVSMWDFETSWFVQEITY